VSSTRAETHGNATPFATVAPDGAVDASAWVNHVAVAVTLAILTALFYVPVLDAGFLNWDDPPYVTANPNIRSLDWSTVVWAFTTFHEGIWHPLTWLSLALDHAIYGLQARGFHLTNLLLHVANTVLVFLVWERMTGAFWRSAVVAALFGLHPMHVESVAWVTERKDVLSTFFWLLTMAAYARYVRMGTSTAYGLVVLAFLMGLLAKPMLVTLPFALLLLDYWPLRRLSRRAVLEKVPLLALALLVTGIAVAAVSTVMSDAVPDPIPPAALVANAVVSTAKYLWLTVWPFRLSPWYSHPWFEGAPLSVVSVGTATLVVVGVSVLAVAVAGRRPYVPVGWFWYVGTLVPVLGLVYNGRQGMADRYAYVPHIGLFVAATWAVADLPLWRERVARRAGAVGLAAALVVLAVLTARQTRVWRDDRTFWGYTARVNPHSFIAHQALAGMLQNEGKTREALVLFRRAVKIRPELARVHMQYGRLLARTGRTGPAAAQYRKAVALEPNVAEHRYGLAQVLVTQKHRASARRQLEQALALRPDYPEAQKSLATLEGGGVATP
jgi:protein O-mannosyl-transferase